MCVCARACENSKRFLKICHHFPPSPTIFSSLFRPHPRARQAQSHHEDLTSVAAMRAVYVAGEDRQGRTCVVLCPDLVMQCPAEAPVGRTATNRKRRDYPTTDTASQQQRHQKSPSSGSSGAAHPVAVTADARTIRPGASRAAGGVEGVGSSTGEEISESHSLRSGEAVPGRTCTASARVPQTLDDHHQHCDSGHTSPAGPPPTTPRRAKNSSGNSRRSSLRSVEDGSGGDGASASAAAAAAADTGSSSTQPQQDLLLLYFLRLMDSVTRGEYVVLLCGGDGGEDAHKREHEEGGRGGGRGRWLNWARFSRLGQIHSFLPRR